MLSKFGLLKVLEIYTYDVEYFSDDCYRKYLLSTNAIKQRTDNQMDH